jgi:multidrug transporter EmrE-like cation transporter
MLLYHILVTFINVSVTFMNVTVTFMNVTISYTCWYKKYIGIMIIDNKQALEFANVDRNEP